MPRSPSQTFAAAALLADAAAAQVAPAATARIIDEGAHHSQVMATAEPSIERFDHLKPDAMRRGGTIKPVLSHHYQTKAED